MQLCSNQHLLLSERKPIAQRQYLNRSFSDKRGAGIEQALHDGRRRGCLLRIFVCRCNAAARDRAGHVNRI